MNRCSTLALALLLGTAFSLPALAQAPAEQEETEIEIEIETIEAEPEAEKPETPPCVEIDCGGDFPFDLNLLFNLGYNRYGLSELNSALTAKGYTPFNENMLALGGSMQFVAWQFLTELEANVALTAPSFNDTYLSRLTAGNVMLNFGYRLKPLPQLSIYPLLGIGVGILDLDFTRRSLQPSFDDFLANPGRQGQIGNYFLTLHAGLGIDWRWDWGFQVGLRGGYLWTPPSAWWSLNDVRDDDTTNSQPVAGGPNITLSGPYLKLMVGF